MPLDRPLNTGNVLNSHQGLFAKELEKVPSREPFANAPISQMGLTGRYDKVFHGINNEESYARTQSSLDQLANGVLKATGTFATSFVGGTVGLLNGIGQMFKDQRAASFFDNDFNRTFDEINQSLENALPNYYTQAELDADWYSPTNIFSANFIGDKVLKNLGYSAGALVGGMGWGSLIRGIGLTGKLVRAGKGLQAVEAAEAAMANAPKLQKLGAINKSLSSLWSGVKGAAGRALTNTERGFISVMGTTGEASIEAYQATNEFRNRLIDEYKSIYGTAPTLETLNEINAYADRVGTNVFAGNVALLSFTNYIQLPKILGSSKTLEKRMINNIEKEALKAGEKGVAKWVAGTPSTGSLLSPVARTLGKPGRFVDKYLLGPGRLAFSAPEAFEEGMQFSIQTGVEDYFNRAYQNAEESSELLRSISSVFGNIFSEGVEKTLNSKEGMESILIGGVSGGLQSIRGNIKERGFFGTGGQYGANTQSAINSLNKTNIDQVLKDGKKYMGIAIGSQQLRQEAIKNNDTANEKDYERDYALAYVMPRVKYGKEDSIFEEVGRYREQAMDKDGFEELQRAEIALPGETQQRFIERINGIENTAREVKKTFDHVNDKYSAIQDKDGKLLYTPEVIDKMVYAISKVTDYDQRLKELDVKLGVGLTDGIKNQLIDNKNFEEGKFGEALGDLKVSEEYTKGTAEIQKLDDVNKDDVQKDYDDYVELLVHRQKFINDYNELKVSPDKFRDPDKKFMTETPPAEEGEKKIIKIKTKSGEKDIEIGTEYFLGRVVEYDKDKKEVYRFPKLTILGENEDGTIQFRESSSGEIRNVSKEKLADYFLGKVSDTLENKKAKFFMENANTIYEHYGIKIKGKPAKGRLVYSHDDGVLTFVYRNAKGEIEEREVTGEDFVAKPGYTHGIMKAVGKLTAAQQQSQEEFAAEKDKRFEAKVRKRLAIVNDLINNAYDSLDKNQKKIEEKKNSLESVNKQLLEVEKKIQEGDLTKKNTFRAATKNAIRQANILVGMREIIENELKELESEQEIIENNITYFESLVENINELPEDSWEMMENMDQEVRDLRELHKQTGKQINELTKIAKNVESALDAAIKFALDLIDRFEKKYPNLPIAPTALREFLNKDLEFKGVYPGYQSYLQANPNLISDLREFDRELADIDDLDVVPNERTLKELNEEIASLNDKLSEYENQIRAKEAVLGRFEEVILNYEKQQQEEKKLLENQKLLEEVLGTETEGIQTAEFTKEFETSPKKSDEILPRATVGVMRGKPHQIRANNFGFNLEKFENRDKLRGVYVTSENEDDIIPGLTDHLRMNEKGQIDETIKKERIIALVIVEEDSDGNITLVDENGKPIPKDAKPLDFAIFQVYPDSELKWGAEFNNESMFRNPKGEGRDEVISAVTEQYKKWRESVLENPSLDERHTISASFGRTEEERDEDGKIIYETRTSVQDAGLVSEDDLEGSQLIVIRTTPDSEGSNLATYSQGTASITAPVGTPILEVPNGIVKLQNRQFTEKEANNIFNAILAYANYMLDPEIGTSDDRAKRVLSWLQSVVYWGIPKDESGKRKPAGYNSIFFEKDEVTGKLMLTISGKGKDFPFTPSYLKDNKDKFITLLSGMYNNINSSLAKDLNEKYEEIVSISEKGEIESRIWNNYQSYLLGNKTPDGKVRPGEELPLSTLMRPVTKENPVNRTNIYFYTADTADNFVIPEVKKKKVTALKKLLPGSPVSTSKDRKAELEDIKKLVASAKDITSKMDDIFKVLDEEKYNKWQEKLDQKQLEKDLKSKLQKAKSEEEIANIITKYLLPKFIDQELSELNKKPSAPAAKAGKKTSDDGFRIGEDEVSEEYSFDNETVNTYTSPKGKVIKFIVSEDVSADNLEAIKVVKGGDLDEVRKALTDGGKDAKQEILKAIYGKIAPFAPGFSEETESEEDSDDDSEGFKISEDVVKATEKRTGKAVSSNVKDALNKKMKRNKALRVALENELKNFSPENWDSVVKWLNDNFPKVPVYRVKNILQATNGRQAWGMFRDGAIYIYENAEVGTVYHEVFHAVWRMFSDPAEQAEVINEMKSRSGTFYDRASLKDVKYSEATEEQLEEKLAEEFRDYVQFKKIPVKPKQGRPFILKLFADMISAIKELFLGPQSDSKVAKMFEKIGSGYYKTHIPYETNLSFAKKGIIDIEDAFSDSESVFSLSGITDKERAEVINEMTYLTLANLIRTDESLFSIPELKKKELYEGLRTQVLQKVGMKFQSAQELVDEYKKEPKKYKSDIQQLEEIMSSTLELMQNIDSQWDSIVDRHVEYLKAYSIDFDENDNINITADENTGRAEYDGAHKIDNFKKANAAIKLLLSTIPKVDSEGYIEPSSIGGAVLLPVGKVYMNLMNNLHTSSSVEEMIDRLRKMAEVDPNYRTLYERITKRDWTKQGVDLSNIKTDHGAQLLGSFWRTFKKQAPEVKNVFILDNGDIVVGEANLSTAAQQLKSDYVNSIVIKARSGEGYFRYNTKENVFEGDPTKIKDVKLDNFSSMVKFLNNMGIPFTMSDVNKMDNLQKKMFREAVSGIRNSVSKTEKIATFSGKVLSIDKRLFELGLLKSTVSDPEFSSTFYNVSGERTQTFIGTNAASDLSNFIKKLTAFTKENVAGTQYQYLFTDSFAQGSNLMSRMFTSSGKRKDDTEDLFTIGYAGGLINQKKGKEKESSKLNYKERLVQELNLNLSGWYLNLVPGDASLEWMIKMGNAVSTKSISRGFTDVEAIFKNYFISEYNLARENRKVAKGRKSNEMRFFLGILGEDLHNSIMKSKSTETAEKVYEKFEKRINTKLAEFINKDTLKLESTLGRYGIIKASEKGLTLENVDVANDMSIAELKNQLTALSVNYMIANIEMHKLLYSDPYQYEDELKRIKSFNSPRQAIINSSPKMNTLLNNIWNKGYSKDDIAYTKFTQDYFRSATHNDVIGVTNLPGYEDFKETDGSGIISMKANRQFRIRAGEWNTNEERQFRYDMAWEKQDKGLPISSEEKKILEAGNPGVKSAYTPIKPIVSGTKFNEKGAPSLINDVVLDKFALYPLSYRIMKEMDTDSNGVKLYDKMQRENIDYIVFSSGRKVGAKGMHETYNESDGSFNDTPYKNDNIINVPFSIMSIQAEVPSKDTNDVTRGSQVTKLVTMDFLQAGVPIDFMSEEEDFYKRYEAWTNLEDKTSYNDGKNLYNDIKENEDILINLIEEGYKNTLDRLGIEETVTKDGKSEFKITDFSKSAQALREEIMKREVNDNISDSLAGFLRGEVILEATPAYQQVRNIIYSIADKEFISQKITGGQKVQIPSTLFEANRLAKTKINGKEGYTSDVLKFYEKDGKRVAEVMLGRWFDSPLSDEELMDYFNNTKEGQAELEAIAGIGFRIPTQKQNSIDAIVIKKFLPKEFGDSVVIPAALVQKVGSDFDIDKLFVYLKNVYIKDGKPKRVPYFGTGQQAIEKLTELFDKGEFLTDKEMKEIDRYIAEEQGRFKDSSSGRLLASIFGDQATAEGIAEEITTNFAKGIPIKDQIIKKLYKKSLENGYIENMQRLVTHPMNYDNLIKPNSAQVMKDLAGFIAEKTVGSTFDYKDPANMLDRTFMSRLRHAFVTGKYAIGIAAVNQTNHSLNQRQPIYIDKARMKMVSEEDKFWLEDGDIKFQKYNTIRINGKSYPTLSMIKNAAGEYISDIIGMFIDGYVDISKGPWIMELGATPNVASTWLFLIKLGVPVQTVTYFMNQPIIRQYLQTIESAGYSWLFIDNYVSDIRAVYAPGVTQEDLYKKMSTFKIPSEAKLKANVGAESSKMSPQEKMDQFLMLKEFLKYAKMAEHLFHVTQGSNFDTANFNDPSLVFKKNMQLQKAQNTIISSVDKLLENSFVGYLGRRIGNIRDAFAEILLGDSKKVRNVIHKVLAPYVDTSDREFVKIAQKAVSDLFDWAVQNDQKFNRMIQDILIEDGGVGKEVLEFANSVKEDPSHPLNGNQVIDIISSIPSRKAGRSGVNNVKLNMAETKVYDQNNIIYSFREIREHLKGEKSDLYERLKILAVLQSGLSSSGISFTSLLPNEDFQAIYKKTLSKLNSIPNLGDFYNLGVFQRNNWNNDALVPYMTARTIETPAGKFYNPSMRFLPTEVKKAVAEGEIPNVMTVSRANREGNSDYIVYNWEKDVELLTEKERELHANEQQKIIRQRKSEMRKAGDFSYMNKGLFKKVYDNYGEPYTTKDNNGKKYFVYKAINAWGDSFRANEFWPTDHKSVIDNGFVKVEDVDNKVIISLFVKGKDKQKTKSKSTPTQPSTSVEGAGTISGKTIKLKNGVTYGFSAVNAKMLSDMGYTPVEAGKILKSIC